MNELLCNYGDIYKRLFSYLPVLDVSFNEARDDDEQEYKHIDWSEDFIDRSWLLHPKWQDSCGEQNGEENSVKC